MGGREEDGEVTGYLHHLHHLPISSALLPLSTPSPYPHSERNPTGIGSVWHTPLQE